MGQRTEMLEDRYWPRLPVFETTIRYLGGLLSAFDLVSVEWQGREEGEGRERKAGRRVERI